MDDQSCRLLMQERSDVAGITSAYLEHSSLHGLRFIGERNRSLCERIFWVVWVAIGVFFSGYFTLGIVQKWQNSPVYMSVSDTSHHVANLPFPAVTICSVNKIEEDRLIKSIKGIEAIQNAQNLTFFNSTMDFEAVIFMIDALINFDKANFSDPYWQWVAKNSPKIRSSDLLKLFRSSMPQCRDLLLHCSWQSQEIDCLRLFKVMTTDDGFCCLFNAYKQGDVMKEMNLTSVSGEQEIGQDGQEDEEEEDEDFSFLDETDYVIYEDCWGDGEDEECDKAYKFGGEGTNDYYDYQETLKDFDKTTKKKKKKKDDSPTQDEKSFKDDNGRSASCRTDQFTCNNGDCIPGELQCNGKKECSDGADEQYCRDAGIEGDLPATTTEYESSPLTPMEKPDSVPKSTKRRIKRQLNSQKNKLEPLPVPQYTMGAGNDLGLSLILHSQVDKYFLTSGTFEGFKVLIHHPEEFSQVRDRGFVLGPGTEVFVGVDGSQVYSTDGARAVSSNKRKCYFHDEKLLGFYTNYTRANCLMECAFKYTKEICGCVPYFYPNNGFKGICGLSNLPCLKNASRTLKSIHHASLFDKEVIEVLQDKGIDCDCPSACDETNYRMELSSAPFPSKNAFESYEFRKLHQKWEWEKLRSEFSRLHIYFQKEFVIQYKRDQLYGIEDLVSNIGGLMGLCLGCSLLSGVEFLYFFTLRWITLLCRRKKPENQVGEMGRILPKSDVFDVIFNPNKE